MHKGGVCHRDIKPANIHISNDLTKIKILDFNCAIELQPGEMTFGIAGDGNFQAPEMANSQRYSNNVDIWNASLVTFNLFSNGLMKLEIDSDEEPEVL